MGFDRPHLLLFLLLVPVGIVLYVRLLARNRRYAVAYTNLAVLAEVGGRRSTWRSHLPSVLGLAVLAALVVGMARPHVTRLAPVEGATVILAIDTSVSMLSEDIRPSRLEAARAAAQAFVDEVPERLRVGVVLFAGDVQVGAPPSDDRGLATVSIESMGPSAVPGTAIGDAVARSVELGRSAIAEIAPAGASLPGSAEGVVSVVFLSDGRQYLGTIEPDEAAARARAAGVPVHTVALGKEITREPDGSFRPEIFGRYAPDPETLEAIAIETGGEFVAATSGRQLTRAYADLGSRLGRAPEETEITALFVGGAVALLVAAGLLSALWWPRLP